MRRAAVYRRAGAGGRGGPIGLGAAAMAEADGAQVVVADTSPARREHVATRAGITFYWTRQPKILTRSYGRSLVVRWRRKLIDATGNGRVMNLSTVNLIRHGGTVVFVGLFKGELQFSDPEFHKKETTMMGSRNAAPGRSAKVGRLMAEGKITADMMLTHRYPFATLAEPTSAM
ncbi:zinc-binding dehydrogenase [Escherichia coli]